MAIDTPRPEYMQVADALRAAIEAGEWEPGALIPPEPELAARYGTTRATVNRALSILRAEGLVRPRQGRGTTVRVFLPARPVEVPDTTKAPSEVC